METLVAECLAESDLEIKEESEEIDGVKEAKGIKGIGIVGQITAIGIKADTINQLLYLNQWILLQSW